MTTVSSHEARQNLAKLIDLAFYKDERIRVKRNNRAMAWIVGAPFMQALGELVDYIIEHEPALADTLTLTVDQEIRQTIEQSIKETKQGRIEPITSILDE